MSLTLVAANDAALPIPQPLQAQPFAISNGDHQDAKETIGEEIAACSCNCDFFLHTHTSVVVSLFRFCDGHKPLLSPGCAGRNHRQLGTYPRSPWLYAAQLANVWEGADVRLSLSLSLF